MSKRYDIFDSFQMLRALPTNDLLYTEKAAERRRAQYIQRCSKAKSWDFKNVFGTEQLIQICRLLQFQSRSGTGLDGVGFKDLSRRDIPRICREAYSLLKEGKYSPERAKPTKIPKKSGMGHRTINVRSVVDRVISYRLAEYLESVWEPRFLGCSYGFRPRKSSWQLLHRLADAVKQQQLFLIDVDIANAFDRVPIVELLRIVKPDIQDPQVYAVLEQVIRGTPPREVGIDQGSSLSPLLLNILLHTHLDLHFQRLENATYMRFADNLLVACTSRETADIVLGQIANRLHGLGMPWKASQKPICEITKNSAEILGIRSAVDDYGQIEFIIPETAFSKLGAKIALARNCGNPIASVLEVIRCWLYVYGPAYDAQQVPQVVTRITEMLTATGIYEVIQQFQVYQVNLAWQAGYRGFMSQKPCSISSQQDHVGAALDQVGPCLPSPICTVTQVSSDRE